MDTLLYFYSFLCIEGIYEEKCLSCKKKLAVIDIPEHLRSKIHCKYCDKLNELENKVSLCHDCFKDD